MSEIKKFEIKTDIELKIEKEKQILDIVGDACSFFREFPHLFAKYYLHIDLKPFQEILLYEMFHNNFAAIIACRGIGKTWLIALYAVIKAILYPGSKICVTSSKLKQAVEVLKKISNDFYGRSDLLRDEIDKILLNGEDPQITFYNGSFIYAVVANKNARSKRSTDNIYDEYVQMDPVIINDVLEPFLTSKRQPGFVNNLKYTIDDVESNKEFYLSSAWYKSEWSFLRIKDYFTNMLLGKNYFACCLPYQLSLESGILDVNRIKSVYDKSDFNIIKFMMEYEGIWFGSNGTEFFSYDDIKPRRLLTSSYPILDNNVNKKIKIPERNYNERRILSLDVALMSGKRNDAACFILNDAVPNNYNAYSANIVMIEAQEGLRTEQLGLRTMQLYYKYDCTDLVIDARGNGQGVIDFVTKEQVDPNTGEVYKAFKAINSPEWAERCIEDDYTESLWIINATEKLNDQCAFRLKTGFESGKINLLVSEYDCYIHLCDKIAGFEDKSEEIQLKYQQPFIETTLLINEMINLEYETKGTTIKIHEKTGMRKDRYSSLAYNFWVMKELEKKLTKEEEKENQLEFMMKKPKTYSDNDYYWD